MRVKGEHLACELPAVVKGDSKAIINQGQHFAALGSRRSLRTR